MLIRPFAILALALAPMACAFASFRSATERIADSVSAFGLAVLAVICSDARAAFDFLFGGFTTPMLIDGSPLDRGLQQSLRHEAGYRHRAAMRHI